MPIDYAHHGLFGAALVAQEATSAAQRGNSDTLWGFPAGFATALVVALIGVAGKYLVDYRLQSKRLSLDEKQAGSEEERARWRFQAEARQEVYSAVGSTQASFVRAAMDLHDRLSSFLENPENTRPWLRPGFTQRWLRIGSILAKDGYYLKDFVRRLFNFYVWGRVAQDAINALPVELVRQRDDLQRLFNFISLANSLITYTWVFKGVENYEDTSENLHLFAGNLSRLTEAGANIWKQNGETLPTENFNKLYDGGKGPLLTLRDMLVALHPEDNDLQERDRRAAFVIARLAVLRAALGAYLSFDHAWALALPADQPISGELARDLGYAGSFVPNQSDFVGLVPRNLGELMDRYRCGWLPVGYTGKGEASETPRES